MTQKRIPASVRLGAILTEVANTGHASVIDIAQRLGVSDMTVRRDMAKLESEGQVLRTHGGAQAAAGMHARIFDLIEPSVENRSARNRGEKRRIAAAALTRITAKSTIALDVGTTCYELAALITDASVRVISHLLADPDPACQSQHASLCPARSHCWCRSLDRRRANRHLSAQCEL